MVDLERKIKLVAVNYLNTKPFLAGLRASSLVKKLDIIEANPSECAELMNSGKADISLIPVASIPNIPSLKIISNYCIGANGAVGSVCLYSACPIAEIETVLLDYQSRTSVALCQLLLKDYWKKEVEFKATSAGYIDEIKGKVAGLVIGDRTFGLNNKMPYCYDLSAAWMDHKGLPFVFANWVCGVALSNEFLAEFDLALSRGMDQMKALAMELQAQFPAQDVYEYFTKKIDYRLDEPKRIALDTFYEDLGLSYKAKYLLPRQQIQSS